LQPSSVYRLQQFSQYARTYPDEWRSIQGFDTVLIHALTSQGIEIAADHPALTMLRQAFARSWYSVIRAKERMRNGLWAFPGEQSPLSMEIESPAQIAPEKKHTESTCEKATTIFEDIENGSPPFT
jgi:hypothetical protein